MEKIDLNRVRLLNRMESVRARKIVNIETPGHAGPYLFYYSVWTFIQNKTHATITESQAADKLKRFPDMEVFFCKLVKSATEMPVILKGRKNLQTSEITGHEALSELIYRKTTVKVSETDLMIKQKTTMKDNRPLGVRALAFVDEVNRNKEKTERVEKIYNQLKNHYNGKK